MELNPYESPRTGEPFEEKPMVDSDAVRQLLTEIRDTQRELLEMQREALLRQRSTVRFSYWFMIVPFIFMAVPLYTMYRTMNRPRPALPAPIRAPSRLAPQVPPISGSVIHPDKP